MLRLTIWFTIGVSIAAMLLCVSTSWYGSLLKNCESLADLGRCMVYFHLLIFDRSGALYGIYIVICWFLAGPEHCMVFCWFLAGPGRCMVYYVLLIFGRSGALRCVCWSDEGDRLYLATKSTIWIFNWSAIDVKIKEFTSHECIIPGSVCFQAQAFLTPNQQITHHHWTLTQSYSRYPRSSRQYLSNRK